MIALAHSSQSLLENMSMKYKLLNAKHFTAFGRSIKSGKKGSVGSSFF